MTKTSAELSQKAAGYMLAASNASKREMNKTPTTKTITTTTRTNASKREMNKTPTTKTTTTTRTTTKTTIIKQLHLKK